MAAAKFETPALKPYPVIPLVAIDQFTISNKRVRNHATLSDGIYGGFADVWIAPN